MSNTQKRAPNEPMPEALEANEFSNLLQREFKPKSDQAREAVQNAVKTLATQAL
ncbi:MAG: type VI secretion system contractile sheath large subunit, partial [Burkholderiaceae bacterium]|nr:type VI secretion system contractile sheath large subunit [Burkholderiaceae bacterium]